MEESEILPVIESSDELIPKVRVDDINVIIVPGKKGLPEKKDISVKNLEFPKDGISKNRATARQYRGMTFLGDDDNYYLSKKDKNGNFIWVLLKKNI